MTHREGNRDCSPVVPENKLRGVNTAGIRLILGGILLLWFGSVVPLVYWYYDRAPPFELISYEATPVKPGSTMLVRAKVKRDLARECSTVYNRFFFDSNGVRWELGDGANFLNASSIREQNKLSPDGLVFSIVVPPAAARGPAVILTAADYRCNPTQQFFPIPVTLVMKVEVL